ncbi:MAG: hypothetical protein JKX92_05440 [Porticoccaceae bacterium]|nr:hypothetical protein [Porticoccaceae bacterium]
MSLRFIIENQHASAVVSATSEALPASYTRDSRRAYAWRSTGTASQTISATPVAAVSANGLAIVRHNLSAGATVRLQLKLNGATVYDSAALAVGEPIPAGVWRAGIDAYGATYNELLDPQIFNHWFTVTHFDEYLIIIDDPSNLAGFLQIGQIFIGQAFEPRYNMSFGLQLEWLEQTEHLRSDAGSLRSEGTQAKHRRLHLGLDWLDPGDRTSLTVGFFAAGKGADIFVSAYPEAGGMLEIEHAFVGRRRDDLGFTHPFHNNWQTRLVFDEA